MSTVLQAITPFFNKARYIFVFATLPICTDYKHVFIYVLYFEDMYELLFKSYKPS